MPNLIDISTIVSTLVTYFAMGGDDAAIEAIKGITVNGALKLAELKDDLLGKEEVIQAVECYQDNPLDPDAKSQLESAILEAIQKDSVIQAKMGSVAAHTIKNSKIKITNTFND